MLKFPWGQCDIVYEQTKHIKKDEFDTVSYLTFNRKYWMTVVNGDKLSFNCLSSPYIVILQGNTFFVYQVF